MVYVYESGSVRRISEVTPQATKLVYQHKHSLAEMMRLYKSDAIEREIESLRVTIDHLLDQRNRVCKNQEIQEIDRNLARITRKLFELEA
ncbi:hypothetical protein D3C75_774220 [compost metagenome]